MLRCPLGPLLLGLTQQSEQSLQSPRASLIVSYLAKVVLNTAEDGIQLVLRGMLEQSLAEEIGNLMHH